MAHFQNKGEKMLKKILLSVSFIVASSFANNFFIGVQGGGAFGKISDDNLVYSNQLNTWIDNELSDSEKNLNAFAYGAKFGYDFRLKENHALKVYLDYLRAGFSGGNEYAKDLALNIASANADYHYYLLPKFSIFGGISLGNVWAKADGGYGSESAFGYGVNVGADYEITQNLEIEVKFRYFDSNLPEKTFKNAANTSAKKVEPDDLSQVTLGINFKF